ncbi:MAG: hypothetical protein I3270_01470 [Candidatus Moeniiplasma glomeromycotorum]|nr:hypothetical protein [Candidatus Moeniiplasma glomeromycotorum]MCE8166302.1 hypothetical protein [Candidatus Moeniiplasma glomeromycotorum]MCE8166784.1 hypothetical protein [Candidatus Moeniiplasma glomeromycotorum]
MLTYRGSLEITSESEEKIFYRCELKLIEEKKSQGGFWIFITLLEISDSLLPLSL